MPSQDKPQGYYRHNTPPISEGAYEVTKVDKNTVVVEKTDRFVEKYRDLGSHTLETLNPVKRLRKNLNQSPSMTRNPNVLRKKKLSWKRSSPKTMRKMKWMIATTKKSHPQKRSMIMNQKTKRIMRTITTRRKIISERKKTPTEDFVIDEMAHHKMNTSQRHWYANEGEKLYRMR